MIISFDYLCGSQGILWLENSGSDKALLNVQLRYRYLPPHLLNNTRWSMTLTKYKDDGMIKNTDTTRCVCYCYLFERLQSLSRL